MQLQMSLGQRLALKQNVGGPSQSFTVMSGMSEEEMEELAYDMAEIASLGGLKKTKSKKAGNLCDTGFFREHAEGIAGANREQKPAYCIDANLQVESTCTGVRERIEKAFSGLKRESPAQNVRELFSVRFLNEFDWITSARKEAVQHAVTHQEEFLHEPYNPLLLKELTQRDIAKRVGCYHTTVSRLVQGLLIQFPDTITREFSLLVPGQRLVGLQCRYVVGLLAQDEEFYDEQMRTWKKSDAAIAKELQSRGLMVQRRAVSNYTKWVEEHLLTSKRAVVDKEGQDTCDQAPF